MEPRPNALTDAVVAGGLLVCSALYLAVAQQEAAGRPSRDLFGQAGFPTVLAVLAILTCGVTLVRALRRWRTEPDDGRAEGAATGWQWEPWTLWALSAAYVLAFRPLGFPLSTLAFTYGGLLIVGFRRRYASAVLAVSTTVALYLIFGQFLNVDLPLLPTL